MKNINIGDIYWMPAAKHLNKNSTDEKLVISKVGTKYIYTIKEKTNTEYQFTFESEGKLRLVNNMCSSTAYSEELWKKQKLIIELEELNKEIKLRFPQINSSTNFIEYHELISRMNEVTQRILDKD